jgi:hypothetical protein
VLLCHSTLSHIGLYAWAWARLGLRCPAFASLPTATMGRLTTLEAADGWRDEMEATDASPLPGGWQRCVPTRQEVDEAFESVRTVRYLQPTQLDGQSQRRLLYSSRLTRDEQASARESSSRHTPPATVSAARSGKSARRLLVHCCSRSTGTICASGTWMAPL